MTTINPQVKAALTAMQDEMRKQIDEVEHKLSLIIFNEHDANWGHVGSAAKALNELKEINLFLGGVE